jgi:nitroreductase
MRETTYGIDPFFTTRFSPRVFTGKAISDADFFAVLEAGGTAPSCFNEQPWRFVIGKRSDFLSILAPANAEWAAGADRFILVCTQPAYRRNGKTNRHAEFDSGTAWGFMTLEGMKRGIYLHAMAGFDAQKAVSVFGLGEVKPMAVVALGYPGEPHTATSRMGLDEVIIDRR